MDALVVYYVVYLAHSRRPTTNERKCESKKKKPTMYEIGHKDSIRIQLHNLWLLRSAFAVDMGPFFLLLHFIIWRHRLHCCVAPYRCTSVPMCWKSTISLLAQWRFDDKSIKYSFGLLLAEPNVSSYILLKFDLMIARSPFVSLAIYLKSQNPTPDTTTTKNVLTQFWSSSAHTRRKPIRFFRGVTHGEFGVIIIIVIIYLSTENECKFM